MTSLPADTVALVTGASSGIGEAAVRALREHGAAVHAAARRTERLDRLATETGCHPLVLDVRDAAAVERLGELAVDIVVNNAGLGRAMGRLEAGSADDVERTVATNVTGAINVTRAVLPGMIERQRGHIVNIGSVAGLAAAGSALYGATKAAIHLFSRNLRLELQGTGIRVTEICPGRVATEFYDVAVDDPEERAAAVDTDGEVLRPSDVAEAILYAVTAPWRVNVSLLELFPTEQTYGGAAFVLAPEAARRRR